MNDGNKAEKFLLLKYVLNLKSIYFSFFTQNRKPNLIENSERIEKKKRKEDGREKKVTKVATLVPKNVENLNSFYFQQKTQILLRGCVVFLTPACTTSTQHSLLLCIPVYYSTIGGPPPPRKIPFQSSQQHVTLQPQTIFFTS